jgi:hypothetical protein
MQVPEKSGQHKFVKTETFLEETSAARERALGGALDQLSENGKCAKEAGENLLASL